MGGIKGTFTQTRFQVFESRWSPYNAEASRSPLLQWIGVGILTSYELLILLHGAFCGGNVEEKLRSVH